MLKVCVRGVPQPLVEFYTVHDNFRIQTGTRISIQHDATNTHWRLVIKNINEKDLREYRAEAKNVLELPTPWPPWSNGHLKSQWLKSENP
uniref:Ig-like domain-containing protein n=1 Tax=Ditylenchus dipsaci TaxID=166011 RepID=A0A915E1H1_9BILA